LGDCFRGGEAGRLLAGVGGGSCWKVRKNSEKCSDLMRLLVPSLVGTVVGGASAPALLAPFHLLGGAIPGTVLVGQGTCTGEVGF
tara:strand:+ start:44 stop:298 length:255 start_codon:yes stop_codon:yes gene_type:complete